MKIVSIERKANPDCVEHARSILRMAESGEITELSCAGFQPDGTLTTWITPTTDQMRRVAGLSRLLHRAHILADEALR